MHASGAGAKQDVFLDAVGGEFIVGVAILSIGSDLPELAIAVDGALKNLHSADTSDVIVGTALGSSLGQIGFVLGVASLFSFLTLPRSTVYRHGSVLLGSVVLLGVFGFDGHELHAVVGQPVAVRDPACPLAIAALMRQRGGRSL